jgi:uncharacterized protein YggU (UPF0235/DUF167 family)
VIRFRVRLTPRGGVDRVDGVVNGMLQVRVAAPPVAGAANDALVRLLARELRVPRSTIALQSGAGARIKSLSIEGSDAGLLLKRWPGLLIR